jgi:hypothetical protein
VLIHGLSIPSMVFKDVAPVLASKGYRVLLYDLYGRGYSDAPQTVYDTSLYATQLALLMQHVRWEKAGVVGISMVSLIFEYYFGPRLHFHVFRFIFCPFLHVFLGFSCITVWSRILSVVVNSSTSKYPLGRGLYHTLNVLALIPFLRTYSLIYKSCTSTPFALSPSPVFYSRRHFF